MQDLIASKTTSIFVKTIKRYAKADSKEPNDVSILLSLSASEEVVYNVCHDFQPVREVTIKDVLNIGKIELGLPLSQIVPPQLKNIILTAQAEQKSKDVEFGVYLDREDDDDINIFLFKEGELVKKVNLSELLN